MKSQMLILLLFVAATGFSQEVIICERFTNTGLPKNPMAEIVVESLPLRLKVLYNNGKNTIDKSKVNMLIEYADDKKVPAEPFYLNVSQSRNWVGSDIEFKYAGGHVVSAFTPENEILASTKFNIILKGKEAPLAVVNDSTEEVESNEEASKAEKVVREKVQTKAKESVRKPTAEFEISTGFNPTEKIEITEEEAKTLHYEGVTLEFGKTKGSKGLEGKSTEFKLSNGRADVTGMLMNQLPIKTKTLQIDIWQKGKDDSFSELTVSEEHACNPNVYKSFFPLKFYRVGEYKVSVYTDDFVWISSAYVTVSK